MTKLIYTNKNDVIRKGLCKKEKHIYKKTILEMWYDKGWLELEGSRFDENMRLEFGLRLMLDFSIINRSNLRSQLNTFGIIDYKNFTLSDSLLDAVTRYNKAIRAIPAEFWPAVKTICLEDKTPSFPKFLSERQRTYSYFLARTDLCRGLDRVIIAYTQK